MDVPGSRETPSVCCRAPGSQRAAGLEHLHDGEEPERVLASRGHPQV